MEKLSVSVYRNAEFMCDCTNDGVSSRHNRMTLFWNCTKEDVLKYCEENGIDTDSVLYLKKRELWGEDHSYAEPLIRPKGMNGPMMGGNFCYTCDSRLYKMDGKTCACPIPIHDRFETDREYNSYFD